MENTMNEKLIKVLYFKGELILLNGSEMLDNFSYYFQNLLKFIRKLKKLEKVKIRDQFMLKQKVAPIITALFSQV